MFHADRQTDGWTGGQTDRKDEANSRFRNFANAPEKRLSEIKIINTLRI